jgi:hypothetical protein
VELAQPAAQPPSELAAPCAPPVDLRGYQGLSGGQVERLWFSDRTALLECGARFGSVLDFFSRRDAALAAGH